MTDSFRSFVGSLDLTIGMGQSVRFRGSIADQRRPRNRQHESLHSRDPTRGTLDATNKPQHVARALNHQGILYRVSAAEPITVVADQCRTETWSIAKETITAPIGGSLAFADGGT